MMILEMAKLLILIVLVVSFIKGRLEKELEEKIEEEERTITKED